MSCGCGCNGGVQMPHGVMLAGSKGLPAIPLTGGMNLYPSMRGVSNLGALGDDSSDSTDYGFTDTTDIVNPVGFTQTGVYTPAGVTPSPTASNTPTTNLLDSLAASWSGAAQQILKSNAGALPTYQTINPLTGASTTVYGSAANIPTSLTTAFSNLTTGSGGLILMAVAAMLVFGMMSKR